MSKVCLLLCALCVTICGAVLVDAAIPDIISDPATREVAEYLDAKVDNFSAPVFTKAEIASKSPRAGSLVCCSNCATPYAFCGGTGRVWVLVNTANACQ